MTPQISNRARFMPASPIRKLMPLADEARRRGAFTVEINPEPTEATERFDVAIQGRAEDVLDRLERSSTEPDEPSSGSRLSSSQ